MASVMKYLFLMNSNKEEIQMQTLRQVGFSCITSAFANQHDTFIRMLNSERNIVHVKAQRELSRN